jgi:hypothetical protein
MKVWLPILMLVGCGSSKSEWRAATVEGFSLTSDHIACDATGVDSYSVTANFAVGADTDRQLEWNKLGAIGPADNPPTDCANGELTDNETALGSITFSDLPPGEYVVAVCVADQTKGVMSGHQTKTIKLKETAECRIETETLEQERLDGIEDEPL